MFYIQNMVYPIFYTYSTSQFGLPTLKVLNSCVMAALLDKSDLN